MTPDYEENQFFLSYIDSVLETGDRGGGEIEEKDEELWFHIFVCLILGDTSDFKRFVLEDPCSHGVKSRPSACKACTLTFVISPYLHEIEI